MWTIGVAACLVSCGPGGGGGSAGGDDGPRYVVLSPALAVMLRDIGQEDRIVARHAHDLVLDGSLPVAGELGRIDYEVVLATRPTHVLIEWGSGENALPERLAELSRSRGFEVMRFELLTLDDIVRAMDRLEDDLPEADHGPERGYWQEQMERAWGGGTQERDGAELAAAGRVLLVASTDPVIGVTGPGSWHHQILEAIGGVPAVTTGAPWMELSVEDVARLAPDGIILIQPRGVEEAEVGWVGVEEVLERLGPVGRLDIPAVRSGRVALLDDPLAHTPSTAMVGLTGQMRGILEAWAEARAGEGASR